LRVPLALLALSLMTSAEAWAQCASPYSTDTLLADLSVAEDAIRKNDGAKALSVADKMEDGFPCMNEPMPFMIVSRAYRAVGAGKVIGGDDARGKEWFLTAIQLDPGFEYGMEDMALDNPARGAFEGQREAAEVAPTQLVGRTFAPGTYYLDGSLQSAPRATLGRPHLFQVKSEAGITSSLIQGNAFPELALAAPVVAAAVVVAAEPTGRKPKPKPEPEPEPEPVAEAEPEPEPEPAPQAKPKPVHEEDPREEVDGGGYYERKRPPEKTPLMIAGGVAILGAGGLYYWSSVTRKKFNESETIPDSEKFRQQTNTLVIASAAVIAVGAGVLTWGIILDDTGRPLPGIHIKF